MSRFDIRPTSIAGVTVIERQPREDHRGFLSRFYCEEEFAAAGVTRSIRQINHTLTRRRGTIRGLHFQQPPYAELKVVSCLRGEIFDVAVDLRAGSPTFLRWHGERLSAANHRALVVPEGFAHGFQALTDDCEILYLVTAAYEPAAESAVNALDPRVGIAWPLPIADMSDRDRAHSMLTSAFRGIDLDALPAGSAAP